MTILQADEIREVFVGDTGPTLNFAFALEDRVRMRDLTGYIGWCTFAYVGEAPHVIRAAIIPTPKTSGIVRHVRLGDEYTKVGEVLAWATVLNVDYGTTLGGGYYRVSCDPIRFKVLARPS